MKLFLAYLLNKQNIDTITERGNEKRNEKTF